MHHSDSLLYEGVTEHARHVVPMFADSDLNPNRHLLGLLTKSANVHYLDGLPTENVVVSFSLNPEPIADLWEGKYPDTMERISPPISDRLRACLAAQKMGFEVRWRLDPILYPDGWLPHYKEFFAEAAGLGIEPSFITLGTFRDARNQLETWNSKRGDPAMEWRPESMAKDGSHYRAPRDERIEVYRKVLDLCRQHFPDAGTGLCKEVTAVRKALDLCNAACNCTYSIKTPDLPIVEPDKRRIVNFSRRVDCAPFEDWFLHRLDEGVAHGINPHANNGKPYKVELTTDEVKLIVLWTKAPGQIVNMVDTLLERGFKAAVSATINDYDKWLEPWVPPLEDSLVGLHELNKLIGRDAVWWRFDPIVPTDVQDLDWFKKHLTQLCHEVRGLTSRCVTSFVNTKRSNYARCGQNIDNAARQVGQGAFQVCRSGDIKLAV